MASRGRDRMVLLPLTGCPFIHRFDDWSWGSPSAAIDGCVEELLRTRPHEMRRSIQATVDSVLASVSDNALSGPRWTYYATKKGVAYYLDSANDAPDQYRYCCVGQAPASAQEVVSLFQATDTAAFQRLARVLFVKALESRVVGVLDAPTAQTPHKCSYVSYISLGSPRPLYDRDVCLVVATDLVANADGSTTSYCLWDSIEVPECPDLVRSRMFRSGYVCWTPPHGTHSEIIYLVGLAVGGPRPRLASWYIMEKIGLHLVRLCSHLRRKRLDSATFCPRDKWPSSRQVTHCRGCVKKLTGLSKRSHCVACGLVFCSTCCVKERLDLPGAGITRLWICLLCLDSRGLPAERPSLREQSDPGLQKILDETFHRLQLHSSERNSSYRAPITARLLHIEW